MLRTLSSNFLPRLMARSSGAPSGARIIPLDVVADPAREHTTKASKTFTTPRRRRRRPTMLSERSPCRARPTKFELSMRSATGNPSFVVSLNTVLDSFRLEPAPFTRFPGQKQNCKIDCKVRPLPGILQLTNCRAYSALFLMYMLIFVLTACP